MFTKQHYKTIAEIIKKEIDHWEKKEPRVQIALTEISHNLADYFSGDNPRFDRNKFMDACGAD